MRRYGFFLTSALMCHGATAADAEAGRAFFRQQCVGCHSAEADDNGGPVGPNLAQVAGAAAASMASFAYTPSLRASGLTWDAPTLDRFLASPFTVVPGTSMVIAVPQAADRANLIAYFQDLRERAASSGGAQKPPPGK